MAGKITEISKNHFEITVEVGRDPGTKKRRRIRRRFHGTKTDAKAFKQQLEDEVRRGTFLDPNNLTVAQYFQQWLDDVVGLKATTTKRRYRQIVELRIIPWLGALPLRDLRPIHLREFYKKLIKHGRLAYDAKTKRWVFSGQPLAVDSIRYHHRVLHSALQRAFEDELIPRNVADIAKPIIPRGYENEEDAEIKVAFLTDDEVKRVIAEAPEPYKTLVAVAVRTGLRRGELLGLKWPDLDLTKGLLSVKRSLAYTPEEGLHFGPPKTKKSRRTIDISKKVIAIFKAHKKRQNADKLFFGQEYSDDGLVFCQSNGQPMHPDTPSSWFPEFLARLNRIKETREARGVSIEALSGQLGLSVKDLDKLEQGKKRLTEDLLHQLQRIFGSSSEMTYSHRTFHALRHTHVTLLLAIGVDILAISERLGHSSTRITYDRYSHLMPGVQREACEGLEALLGE
ncbi:MAG: tyrosine-type recombinase/integrase [Candidatus Desulforudaceae bacterium]